MGYKHFTISDNQRKEYASGFLLDLIIKRGYQYTVVLMDADKDLEPLFVYMMSKDYLTLDKKNNYVHTQKGLEKLENLKKRYEEYLAHFDLFCAVDLESGEFAFEKIFELDDEEWELYVNDERFVDRTIRLWDVFINSLHQFSNGVFTDCGVAIFKNSQSRPFDDGNIVAREIVR